MITLSCEDNVCVSELTFFEEYEGVC